MIILEKQFQLQDAMSIDTASEELEDILACEGVDRKQILRIKLSAEEVLLRWRDSDEHGNCRMYLEKKFGSLYLEIVKDGSYLDPFDSKHDMNFSDDAFSRNLMVNLGVAFKFNYWRDSNCVSLTIKTKKSEPIIGLAVAIGSAIVAGILLNLLLPQFAESLNYDVLTPLFDCFAGVLGAVVGPSMFLSVVWGLYSVGDTTTLGKMGKVLFGRLMLMSLISAVIAGVILFFTVSIAPETGGESSGQLFAILKIVLGIVPSNFVDAFLQGNALQIIFMAVITGFILIMLRSTSYNVITIIDECNGIFQTLLELIGSIMPVFVFVNVLRLVLSNDILMFGSVWKLFAVFFGAIAVWVVIQTAAIPLKVKVSPAVVFKKMLPTFIINLTTASSASSFSTSMECCEKKFGIQKKLVKIGLPLGMVVFKPATVIYFSALSVFCANVYDVPITISSFLVVLIVSIILSVAVPPVAGGNLACYTLLFMQLGIPLDALSIAIALDVVLDFFITSFDIALLQIQILHASAKLQLVDNETLRKK